MMISSYNIFDSKQTYIWQEAKIRLLVSKDKFDRKRKSLEAYFRRADALNILFVNICVVQL